LYLIAHRLYDYLRDVKIGDDDDDNIELEDDDPSFVQSSRQESYAPVSGCITDVKAFSSFIAGGKDLLNVLQDLQTKIHKTIEKSKALRSELQSVRDKQANVLARKPDNLKFNVGGQVFCLRKETIAKYRRSLLFCVISTEIWAPDSNDEYFFDRDPDYFQHVVEFYRSDEKVYPKEFNKKLLAAEYEYFLPTASTNLYLIRIALN